jgi:hypothetical protein
MNRRQTRTSLAIVGMAVLATMVTTTISHAQPASALGHSNKPDGLSDFLGLPLSGIEELLTKGGSNFPDPNGGGLSQLPSDAAVDNMAGVDGPNPDRTPGNEMGSTNTPGQGGAKGGEGVPTDNESVAGASDNSESRPSDGADSSEGDENGGTEHVSTDAAEDEEDEDFEEDEEDEDFEEDQE